MPQLDISTYASQIFWLILCFGTVLFFMVRFLIPRLENVIRQRTRQFQKDMDLAKQFQADTLKIQEQGQKQMEKAHHKAGTLIHTAMEKALLEKQKLVDLFEKELSHQVETAKKDLAKEVRTLRCQTQEVVQTTVKQLAPKVVGQDWTDTEIRKTIQSIIKTNAQDERGP